MGHDVIRPKKKTNLNCRILSLKQPVHERENILFIALYLWCSMAIQYLNGDLDLGLYVFLYYVCVLYVGIWVSYFNLQRKHAIICKQLNIPCTAKIYHD